MYSERRFFGLTLPLLCLLVTLLGFTECTKKPTAFSPVDLQLKASVPFRFVAYGDTRFHDPNRYRRRQSCRVRQALVKAIAEVNPAFICFTGDIVYNGYDANDWKVWDDETSIWRDKKIPVYPALGNHDLHGDEKIALGNYFQRFPDLKNSRYYSRKSGEYVGAGARQCSGGGRGTAGTVARRETGQHSVGCRLRLPNVSPSTLHQLLGRQEVYRT